MARLIKNIGGSFRKREKTTKFREKMANEVEDLAIQLESGMEISNMEFGVKLIPKVLVDQ